MNTIKKIGIAALAVTTVAGTTVAVAGRGHGPERMIERAESRLELDDNQSAALRTLVDTLSGVRDTLRGEDGGAKAEIGALLASSTLDQGAALAMIESRADTLREQAPAVVAAAAGFLDGLDAEQRAELTGMLERRGGRHDR